VAAQAALDPLVDRYREWIEAQRHSLVLSYSSPNITAAIYQHGRPQRMVEAVSAWAPQLLPACVRERFVCEVPVTAPRQASLSRSRPEGYPALLGEPRA
jgi:hypothetical protein